MNERYKSKKARDKKSPECSFMHKRQWDTGSVVLPSVVTAWNWLLRGRGERRFFFQG